MPYFQLCVSVQPFCFKREAGTSSHHSALQSLLVRSLLQVLIVFMTAVLHLTAAVLSQKMAGQLEAFNTD